MTTPIYDAHRQVFALSLLSNRVMAMDGTPDALLDQLQFELSAFIRVAQPNPPPLTPSSTFVQQFGAWELVWGPGGVGGRSGAWQVLNNAVYVAYCPAVTLPNQSQPVPVYVVAIAATNPASLYDWVVEDAWVKDTVAFEGWNPLAPPYTKYDQVSLTTPLISMGTALGVGKLLGLTAPANAAGAGQSLSQFLAGLNPPTGTTLCFTGHSLAGALAPTLALYLKTQSQLAAFDQVLVYPSAGATPGNGAFAKLYQKSFPAVTTGTAPYQAWNLDMVNTLDVVPHAWAPGTLAQIPGLYGNTIANAPATIKQAVAAAEATAASSKALYTPIANVHLQGTTFTQSPCMVPPATTEQFLVQAYFQHMNAYWSEPDGQPGLILAEGLPQVSVPLLPGVTRIGEPALMAGAEQALESRIRQLKSR